MNASRSRSSPSSTEITKIADPAIAGVTPGEIMRADSLGHSAPSSAVADRTKGSARKERNQPVAELIANSRSRNLCSIEETILELYHSNLSMHQLVSLVDQIWDKGPGLEVVARLHREVVAQIETWRGRPIPKRYPYVFLAGIELKCSCGHLKKQASVLMAMGVDEAGEREVLGVAEGEKDQGDSWHEFLLELKSRGLVGVRLLVGNRCEGLADRTALIFPGARFQASVVQFHHDILSRIPVQLMPAVETMLEHIDDCNDWPSASKLAVQMVAELERLNLPDVAGFYDRHVWVTLNYLAFPCEHWRGLRSNFPQTKLLRGICERTRMVGAFSEGASAVHLVSARLRHIEATVWRHKHYPWGRL